MAELIPRSAGLTGRIVVNVDLFPNKLLMEPELRPPRRRP